jgi:hypothetical protein
MFATLLQVLGLALIILAAAMVSAPFAVAACGVVAVYVGLAAERD